MNKKQTVKISKFMSLVLRHKPETINLTLDKNGWASVDDLIRKMNGLRVFDINRATLNEVVATNDKKRFAFNDDGTKIRASQGHSIKDVDLDLKPVMPPEMLYHGTAAHNSEVVHKEGIIKMGRNHVHLSSAVDTAIKVGSRHGQPLVLIVDAKKMYDNGHVFYLSENKVWLTDHVPAIFLKS